MSMMSEYWKEREDRETLEDEFGFLTFTMANETDCYIVDLWVRPEYRKLGKAAAYADRVCDYARRNGKTRLIGSVDPTTNGATESLKVLLAYGMRLLGISGDGKLIYFVKDI